MELDQVVKLDRKLVEEISYRMKNVTTRVVGEIDRQQPGNSYFELTVSDIGGRRSYKRKLYAKELNEKSFLNVIDFVTMDAARKLGELRFLRY